MPRWMTGSAARGERPSRRETTSTAKMRLFRTKASLLRTASGIRIHLDKESRAPRSRGRFFWIANSTPGTAVGFSHHPSDPSRAVSLRTCPGSLEAPSPPPAPGGAGRLYGHRRPRRPRSRSALTFLAEAPNWYVVGNRKTATAPSSPWRSSIRRFRTRASSWWAGKRQALRRHRGAVPDRGSRGEAARPLGAPGDGIRVARM